MPFKSEAQRRFMHAKHPKIAKKWEKHTPKGKKLPEKVSSEAFLGQLNDVLMSLTENINNDLLNSILYKISKSASDGDMPFDMPRTGRTALASALGMNAGEFEYLMKKGLIAKRDEGIVVDQDKYNQLTGSGSSIKAPPAPHKTKKTKKTNVAESTISKRLARALKRV